MRPLPLPFWQKHADVMAGQEVAVDQEGWRPPYWDRDNWALCAVPGSRDVDEECLSTWLL